MPSEGFWGAEGDPFGLDLSPIQSALSGSVVCEGPNFFYPLAADITSQPSLRRTVSSS
jgi:hypothetical protein